MKNNESRLQRECVKLFRLQYPGLTLFAIPNGGKRSITTAAILKAEGVLPGVADLFLIHSNGSYHGLFIELKWGANKQTETQIEFEAKAKKAGYHYAVCYDFDTFVKLIENYING